MAQNKMALRFFISDFKKKTKTFLKLQEKISHSLVTHYEQERMCTFGKHGQNIRAAPAPGASALVKHRVELNWILLPP